MGKLFDRLREYADSDHLPMHMPGHKRRMGEVGNPFFIDITEIDGFDNLHHAEGILKDVQMRAASLYHAEETHYLINGSTAGILSAVFGCTSFGGKILLARNSHKSAYHAALLRGLHVQYIYPQSTEYPGINGVISYQDVDKALKEDPAIQAVFITSPTYDGVVSDVEKISSIAHNYKIPLIVDEAHGAHFPFSCHFPKDSVSCRADVVVHSLHKTLPSLTQTGLIHLNGTLIDKEKIRKYLAVFQTSSPSYVLMAGLDNCVEWIIGHPDEFERFWERICVFRRSLQCMKRLKLLKVPGMDRSRIIVSVEKSGLNGRDLEEILRREYHIELEMACSFYVCAITTVADTEKNLERLSLAFLDIDKRLCQKQQTEYTKEQTSGSDTLIPADHVCTLLEAEEKAKESCLLTEACGRISGDFAMLYPPGIPILAPGEVFSQKIIERLEQYVQDGFCVHGISEGFVKVLKNTR